MRVYEALGDFSRDEAVPVLRVLAGAGFPTTRLDQRRQSGFSPQSKSKSTSPGEHHHIKIALVKGLRTCSMAAT